MPAETISRLVSDLPETYQPIYGRPELSNQASRPCHDRLESVLQVYSALQQQLGRPLKVLDLGCAQGFFSLSLAELGATVQGIDYLSTNVAVCNALAQESPHLKASFETCRIEQVLMRLEPDQYDLVLGLSVFHHIVHESGTDAVKNLLGHAASVSSILIVELALCEEPLYWSKAQPRDPRALLEPVAFVHEVARHSTHLSSIARPMYVASNRYWAFSGLAGRFDEWAEEPHALAQGFHKGTRRYFFGMNAFVKTYRFDRESGDYNKTEFVREREFLEKPPPGFSVPACLIAGENSAEGWIVTERLHGELLLDVLREGAAFDQRGVLLSVLAQLTVLEAAGLCHDDVRTWNILVTNEGTGVLIDFGSISAQAPETSPRIDSLLSFLILVRETTTGVVDDPTPPRIASISPYGLPQPFQDWAVALWQRPLPEWTFKLMNETLLQMYTDVSERVLPQPAEPWIQVIKDVARARELHVKDLETRTQQAETQAHQAEARARTIEAILTSMHRSYSWRLTRPLRWLNDRIRSLPRKLP